ncbi:acyltransferase [Saccharicrinis fermentans]|uniref:Putative acetyltransferase n=1 Tax=Saccharicrinis fermentans DSM 9555 = JCM 21142 TaxID=869213 RepID=W7YFL6_9BACT|nr:acyltransferase [Saccharicrinis fermentans]GAF03241.1 putative acetyltransferase [Saccharicrinis fermentans DSM 9555 = JCM 21142]
MKLSNIQLGNDVDIDPSTSINNVFIEDGVKISKRCSVFGGANNPLFIGKESYIGMNSMIEGFWAKINIGHNVSIAQNVCIMSGSGPNASEEMQKIFPVQKGEIHIGEHSWIGASSIIMPNVQLGRYCVVAANSFVNKSFGDFAIIGGSPAKLIRLFTEEEIKTVTNQNTDSSDKCIQKSES